MKIKPAMGIQARPCLAGMIPVRSLTKTVLAMKLTVLLLTVGFLNVHASGVSQTITFSGKDVPLKKVFAEIKRQTGYGIIYSTDLFREEIKLNIAVKGMALKDFLQLILKGQPVIFKIGESSIFITTDTDKSHSTKPELTSPPSDLPRIKISGTITGSHQQPLAGATVSIKGKHIYTTTDEKGYFELEAETGVVLLVSYVGHKSREFRVTSNAPLRIALMPLDNNLDTAQVVVNTGYQKLSPNQMAGSFEFISKEQLNKRSGPNILSRLEGVSTSILFSRRNMPSNALPNQVDQSKILIRGLSTLKNGIFEGQAPPLVILNNFPYEGNINNINPEDVENITVLKDAAATSIYGAKAANGVIVITTRQGKFNQPMQIAFNSTMTITEKPDLFALPQMSSSSFIDVETFLFKKGFYDAVIDNPLYQGLSPVVELLSARQRGLISPSDSANQIEKLRSQDVRNDFDKYIYRTALTQQYSLSLSGGTEKYKYAVSGGFDKGESNLKGLAFTRSTFRTDNTYQLSDKVSLNLNLGYSRMITKNNVLGNIGTQEFNYSAYRDMQLYPYARFADEEGRALSIPKEWREGYTDTAGAGKLMDWKFRPIDELKTLDRTITVNDLLLNGSLTYKLSRSLNVVLRYQVQRGTNEVRTLEDESAYYTRNLINLGTQIDGNNIKYAVPKGGILRTTNMATNAYAGNLQFNYNKTWNSVHQVNAFIAGEIRHNESKSAASIAYGYNKHTETSANVDFVHPYPLYGNRGLGLVPNLQSRQTLIDRFVSINGSAAYTYDNRYIFNLNGRRDATNVFGVDINDKWSPVWAIGAGWIISNERFFSEKLFSYLKLRASFGYQGNTNNKISPYVILRYQDPSLSSINQLSAFIEQPGNPSLKWETTGQWNLAVDFRALKVLSGTVEVFRKQSRNLLGGSPMDRTTGLNNVVRNNAGLQSKGIELTLLAEIGRGGLKWMPTFRISYLNTKLTQWGYDVSKNLIDSYVGPGKSMVVLPGKSPFALLSYPFAGLDPETGHPLGYLGKQVSKDYYAIASQQVDTANVVDHGPAEPKYSGTFSNSFSFKNFSLHIALSFDLGYFFFKESINYYELFNRGKQHPDFEKRWKKPGDEAFTDIPSMSYPDDDFYMRDYFYSQSSANIRRGDHLRLEYIRLEYSLNNSLPKRLPFKNIQFSASLNNLGLLWVANKERIDPEFNTGQMFPTQKNATIGISIGF